MPTRFLMLPENRGQQDFRLTPLKCWFKLVEATINKYYQLLLLLHHLLQCLNF